MNTHEVRSLSDTQLLATLLGVTPETAEALLEPHAGQLDRLFSEGPCASALLPADCRSRVLALRELACRLAADRLPDRDPLNCPEHVARYLNLRYRLRDQEILGALFLDNTKRLITEAEIYRGTLNSSTVEPREILKQALFVGAASILVFHTHPSGDPVPSVDDQVFTTRLGQAANLLGIPLLDHLILGASGRFTSLRDFMAW